MRLAKQVSAARVAAACAAVGWLLISPAGALAAGDQPLALPVWSVAPFAILLLAIALLPLVAEHFWHKDRNKAIVVVLLSTPVVAYLAYLYLTTGRHTLGPLIHELGKYASFIIMLASLYTVAGGIVIRANFAPSPLRNASLLALGAVLANLIGTTGASVLLIRPFLRINAARKRTIHLPVFFILVVSNLGGCLTPLGDPPMYMGYLNGVPFAWTLRLWPQFLVANGLVLALFLVWETITLRGEEPAVASPAEKPGSLRVDGKINLLFLAGIMLAVVVESDWLPGQVSWYWELFGSEALMLLMAILSLWFTPRSLREDNAFNWAPITEVAILFAGIFITMVPALDLLEAHGHALGLNEPWEFFWGMLAPSAILDNAPTYLAFTAMAAGGSDFSVLVQNQVAGMNGPLVLQAISCAAVFMGGLTYIANGPNFMVKAIAEGAGYRTPSFFGYAAFAAAILLPVYAIITVLFFR
jgi:Na+/H+ antiporter NhaD/arsenite permease-like protein